MQVFPPADAQVGGVAEVGRAVDVTDLVRGSRWATAVAPTPAAVPTRPVAPPRRAEPAKPKPEASVTSPSKPKPRKGIQLDENGIPVDR